MKSDDTPRTDYVENGPYPNRAMPHLARDLEREVNAWKATAQKLSDIIQRAHDQGNLDILLEADGQCFIGEGLARLGQHITLSNVGTQRPGTPDGPLATEKRKPGSLE